MEQTVIAEGKTKVIWSTSNPKTVLIESKDDITAGDGERRDVIEDKAKIATETTVNCFRFLTVKGVPNHFIRQIGAATFEAQKVSMIPIEIVVRRLATGSYLKRRPDIVEGTILDYPVEFFFKDDANHDPLMIHDFVSDRILYFDPKKPLASGFLKEEPLVNPTHVCHELLVMRELGVQTFKVLESASAGLDVTLVDLKIECGVTADGEIVVADVIDNDSWRIWPKGDKAQMKDKEVYRGLAETTPAALGAIKDNYTWVAEQTRQFLRAA